LPTIVFGSALLGVGSELFFNPVGAEVLIHHSPWLRNMGLSLLAAMVVYAVFAVIYVKKRGLAQGAESVFDKTGGSFPEQPGANMVNRVLGNPVLGKTLALMAKRMAPMMSKMMVKMYAPVFEQINLSQEQRAQLQELILKKNAVNMDKGMALMDRKLDVARRAAAIEEMKSAREGCDGEIRRLLGDRDYPVFEQFEKGLPDRLVLNMFKSKSARMGAALSEEQQEQLLHAVGAARAQYHWSTDLSRRIQNPADLVATFSEENIATFALEEEEFERQFLTQAKLLLTPEQFAAFQPFQAKQRQAKTASMKMTARMFTPVGVKPARTD